MYKIGHNKGKIIFNPEFGFHRDLINLAELLLRLQGNFGTDMKGEQNVAVNRHVLNVAVNRALLNVAVNRHVLNVAVNRALLNVVVNRHVLNVAVNRALLNVAVNRALLNVAVNQHVLGVIKLYMLECVQSKLDVSEQ